MAEASLAELGYCLHVARRLGYISEQTFTELELEVKKGWSAPEWPDRFA
jgi:hypothetical protein